MSTRARIIAAQAAAVAALVLVVYLTLLREDSGTPLPGDIQAPGGQQVQKPPPDNDGNGNDKGQNDDGAKGGQGGKGSEPGDANGSPGLAGPAGTGTVIVGGPGWMGSFQVPQTASVPASNPPTPPTDQYADAVGKLLGQVGSDSVEP